MWRELLAGVPKLVGSWMLEATRSHQASASHPAETLLGGATNYSASQPGDTRGNQQETKIKTLCKKKKKKKKNVVISFLVIWIFLSM